MLNDELRLLARIWIKIKMEGVDIVEEQGSLTNSWSDLTDNAEDLMCKKEKFLDAQYCLLGTVVRKVDMPKMIVSLYGKMMINFFSLRADTR